MYSPLAHSDQQPSQQNIVLPLQAYKLLKLTGRDAARLLQGQMTCDIDTLDHQSSHFAAHCNPQGRVRFLCRLIHWQDAYYMSVPATMQAHVLLTLKNYARFSSLSLEPVANWGVIGVRGPHALELLTASLGGGPRRLNQLWSNAHIAIIKVPGETQAYQLWGAEHDLSDWIQRHQDVLLQKPLNHWRLHGIRSGVPEIYPSATELFLPHYLNLKELGALNFDKGCFIGQEIIARMEYKSQIKRHLYYGELDTAHSYDVGLNVMDEAGRSRGRLVMSVMDGLHRCEGLFELEDTAFEAGGPLSLEGIHQSIINGWRRAPTAWD